MDSRPDLRIRVPDDHHDSPPQPLDDSPASPATDEEAGLILVHDDEDDGTNHFQFSESDDDDDNDQDDSMSPQFEIRKASIPPLPPSSVFLYLLSPYLKLGAMFLPYTQQSLKYGLIELLSFAVLAVLARHVSYMFARYLRKATMEEVVCDAFARERGKERQREALRALVKALSGSMCTLIATTYLRESVQTLLPLLPEPFQSSFSAPLLTIFLSLLVLLLSSCRSLASKRVVYATWLSIFTYIAWLACIILAHFRGVVDNSTGWVTMGAFWQGISIAAFSFTSASTLPLYASLKGTTQLLHITSGASKSTSYSRSFRVLALLSVLTATLLMLPSVLFSAFPDRSENRKLSARIHASIAAFHASTLLLGIPSILLTTPTLPVPERLRRTATFSISKTITFVLVVVLALVPSRVSSIMSDTLMVLALASTYFIPALIHISIHFFKRPLSIVMPTTVFPQTPRSSPPSASANPYSSSPGTPRMAYDELLHRKERALQKKQSRKRIVWDLVVWLLLCVSVAAVVCAVWGLIRK